MSHRFQLIFLIFEAAKLEQFIKIIDAKIVTLQGIQKIRIPSETHPNVSARTGCRSVNHSSICRYLDNKIIVCVLKVFTEMIIYIHK